MKKTLRLSSIAVGALVLGTLGVMTPQAQDKQIVIRYATPSPQSAHTSASVIWFAEQVEKRSKGRVKIQVHWNGSLVPGPETLNAVSTGLVEMGKIFTVSYKGQIPLWNIGNLAFLNPDPFVAMSTLRDMRAEFPAFRRELEKQGITVIADISAGPTSILSRAPIKSLSDLKGLKVRAAGVQADALKVVGAVPVSIAYGELYEALQRGIVDAATVYEPAIISSRLNEVTSHLIYAPLGQAVQGEIVNTAFWNGLPKDVRDLLQETMDEAIIVFLQSYQGKLESDRQKMKTGEGNIGKLEFYALPEDQAKDWEKRLPDPLQVWLKDNKRHGATEEMVKRFRELEAKYANILKTQGYPKSKQGH